MSSQVDGEARSLEVIGSHVADADRIESADSLPVNVLIVASDPAERAALRSALSRSAFASSKPSPAHDARRFVIDQDFAVILIDVRAAERRRFRDGRVHSFADGFEVDARHLRHDNRSL